MKRLASFTPLALVIAALALPPGSLPAQQSTITGEWEAEWSRWNSQWRLHLEIRTRIDGARIHSGNSVEFDEFTGNAPQRDASGRIEEDQLRENRLRNTCPAIDGFSLRRRIEYAYQCSPYGT